MKNTKLITIISQPRSGTNFILNNLIQKLDKICLCGELYCEKPYIPEQYYYVGMEQEYTKLGLIERLLECCDEEYLIHKVFESQVTEQEIKSLIQHSDFVFFIIRNDIDRYISTLKAIKTLEFLNYDYTGVKVEFTTEDFIQDINITKHWYQNTGALCDEMGKPTMIIDYDKIMKLPEREQILYCRDQLTQLLGEELCIDFEKEHFTVAKQNNSIHYADSISNYDEVKEFIIRFGGKAP